jgi:DNA-binding MarR family transcriptional regulator
MSYLRHLRPDIPPTASVAAAMADVCHALDGLPQALESAASWLSLYTPSQLRETAESAPLTLTLNLQAPRTDTRRSFQQALQQSVSRLEPEHSRLLRVMAAGAGPWNMDAIAEQTQYEPAELPRSLHALILRGLVRPVRHERAHTKFVVLNLVRQVMATRVGGPLAPRIAFKGRDELLSCAI